MTTITFDSAALGIDALIIVLSLLVGFFGAVAGVLVLGFGAIIFGFVEAVASGGRSRQIAAPRSHKGFTFIRAVIWFGLIVGSFAFILAGHNWAGYLSAVVGGICLPIAVGKLLSAD